MTHARSGLIVLGALFLLATGCGRTKSGATDPGTPGTPHGFVLAVAVAPNPADKGQVVTIDASVTSVGVYQSYVFDFGDGSAPVTQSSPLTDRKSVV